MHPREHLGYGRVNSNAVGGQGCGRVGDGVQLDGVGVSEGAGRGRAHKGRHADAVTVSLRGVR